MITGTAMRILRLSKPPLICTTLSCGNPEARRLPSAAVSKPSRLCGARFSKTRSETKR